VSTFLMGRTVGLLVCTHCHATLRAIESSHAVCPRCGARVHARRPHSLGVTAALVLTAAALYIPANLLPVMHTHTFFSEEDDTILSGVLSLIQEGSWPLALLVFVASIVVPLLKLVAMGWLLISVMRRSRGSGRVCDRAARVAGANPLAGDHSGGPRRPRLRRGGGADHARRSVVR